MSTVAHRGRVLRVMTMMILAASVAGCREEACRLSPPNDAFERMGPCDRVLGFYFEQGECRAMAGCSCGDDCDEWAPFPTGEECVATCE
ncbi:MAG: hypothetical protein EP330_22725 [Deltaproteobacteria bacterium]|nr:MAG: hypothetical protein EP330_22725 [Deltaproteobacteria bacterium]